MKKNPFDVVKQRYVTEKARVLENLKNATSNKCVARCENPKYLFLVDPKANKQEIAQAVEEIYSEQGVKVVAVNTINVKPKIYNPRGKMKAGRDKRMKKAIVTLAVGGMIES